MDTKKPIRDTWGLTAVLVLALFSALFGGAVLYISYLSTAVTERVGQELVSPDGRHKSLSQ